MATRSKPPSSTALAPLRLVLLFVVAFFCFAFLPRVRESQSLLITFLSVSLLLGAALFLLHRQVINSGRKLSYTFDPKPVHYVQFMMHSLIYAYWGWYWPEVYRHIPLILAQIVFAYALNMLLGWFRKDTWILGFGPIPIILSTNLFMWFRDDWFALQFLMIAVGVFGKEFLKWKRDGQMVHIFNPSAFGLFVFSVGLILTHSTPITWSQQIALTFHSPPNIYLEIFCVGLVVQALFSVTLVTLSAAAMLFVMNLIYTRATGVYFFVDSTIPPAVFLGLHLLVTDPATSPRSTSGKILFGAGYGASVFGLYALLNGIGAPSFYDKLLCVPPLNLTVRAIDYYFRRVDAWFISLFQRIRPLAPLSTWNIRQLNYAYMSIWIILFASMSASGFLGHDHPGKSLAFWEQACHEGRYRSCEVWVDALSARCAGGDRDACMTSALVLKEGHYTKQDENEAAKSFGRACDLGSVAACGALADFMPQGGDSALSKACEAHDGVSCFILGNLNHKGMGLSKDDSKAFAFFLASCSGGFPRGCGRLGESYLYGEGTSRDAAKAIRYFEQACREGFGPSCMNAGQMYHRGDGTNRDEAMAHTRFEQACRLGVQPACSAGEDVPLSGRMSSRSGSDN